MNHLKSNLFKTIALSLLFFCTSIYCQENILFSEPALFLKGNNTNTKIEYKNELKSIDNFNFNPLIDFAKDKISRKGKNIISKNGSLFVVFKSESNKEDVLFSMERGPFKIYISNQKVFCDKEILLNKGNSKNGLLISYLYNKNSLTRRKNGNLIIEDLLFEDDRLSNQIAELIYIPRCITSIEKSIIESYLSIKYGVSLSSEQNYYNSEGDKIWDVKQNDGFNNNITGIGKDTYFGLNQMQSKNSSNDGLTIGLHKIMNMNSDNKASMKDREYVMWGDNGKDVVLEKDKEISIKHLKRIWKMKTSLESTSKFKSQIKIDKKLMPFDSEYETNSKEFIWLAIDSLNTSTFNYQDAKYIKASINNENEIVFDNIEINSEKDFLFTLVKASESEIYSKAIAPKEPTKQVNNDIVKSDEVMIYPNPINANEKFYIQFNLIQTSNIMIQIADVNGKMIKTKYIEGIKNHIYSESLSVSGTYLIIVSIDGIIETSKLIVK